MPDIGAGGSVGIIGHSQGGGAALWSAQLAPTYAPELDVRGVIAAAPAAELAQISDWLVGPESGQRAWINALLLGSAWHTVYELPLDAIFDATNQDRANTLQSACPFDIPAPDQQPLLTNPALLPGWRDEFTANTPGGAKSNAPILVIQGTADEQIPVDSTRTAVQRLCGAGDAVELRIVEGGSHGDALFAQEQLDLARDWMADRFAGKSASHGCAG
jgi:pimeloyl-ACP methyl ester carboxylesterase